MWVPSGLTDRYYVLVSALEALKDRLDSAEARQRVACAPTGSAPA
jgi:hypothetical protein